MSDLSMGEAEFLLHMKSARDDAFEELTPVIDGLRAEIAALHAELDEARKVIEAIVADYDGKMLLVEYEGCSPTEIEDAYKHVEAARAFLARKEAK